MMEALSSSEARLLQEPHGVTSQKTPFFIVMALKTSNLTISDLLIFGVFVVLITYYSPISDSGSRIYIPKEQGVPVIPLCAAFLYRLLLNTQLCGGGILTLLHTGKPFVNKSEADQIEGIACPLFACCLLSRNLATLECRYTAPGPASKHLCLLSSTLETHDNIKDITSAVSETIL
jgi:hypothetical protein